MKTSDGKFRVSDKLNLYYRCWLPDGEPKAILLVVHGLNDHSGRYTNLVNYFVPRGFAVYGFDLRGHGKSEGFKCYIDRFSSFTNDLDVFTALVRAKHPRQRIYLVGHSMGGTVAAAYALTRQADIDGLILSGVLLGKPPDVVAGTVLAARVLSLVMPRCGLYVIDAGGISRDKQVVKAYVEDPLVYRGKIRARLGVELLKTMATLMERIPDIRLPILVMHGSADRLSVVKNSVTLYERAGSADKTLKVYEGFFHEIFNEPGHELVLADIEAWLTARI